MSVMLQIDTALGEKRLNELWILNAVRLPDGCFFFMSGEAVCNFVIVPS